MTVVGVTSPAVFRQRRTLAEVDAFVVDIVETALARTGARQVYVMGQSYGADVLQTGIAHLPSDLRTRVAGIILVLPGDTAYFRADPTGWSYHGKPDSDATATANTLSWAPLTCIYGAEEEDSLCPHVTVPRAQIVALPGGHNLDHDEGALVNAVWKAIQRHQ